MPIEVVVENAKPMPVFVGGAAPASMLVPNKREALEALANVERVANQKGIRTPESFDVLRRFILTR